MSVKFNEKYVEAEEVEAADTPRGASIYTRRASRRGSVINPCAPPPPQGVLVNSDRAYSVVSERREDFTDLHDEAHDFTDKETSMGFWQGLRTYHRAAAWSVLLSSSIIMEGYDTNLLGSLFAFPPFKRQFGEQLSDGQYQISSGWQTGLTNGAQVGSLIGLALNGVLCDKIGYKKTYFIALSMMTAFIFLPFFATNNSILLAGQVLSGIPWGMFQTLSVAYASEVCPVCLRGYLTTYANICWVIGQVLSSGMLRGFLSQSGQWAYRIPFAIQWVFIPPIFIGVIFAPESPWWLVRHGYLDQAAVVVRRLMSTKEREDENNVTNTISQMQLTNEHEQALSAGTTYLDCFKGIDLRRTEVATITWACQNMSGSALMGFCWRGCGLGTHVIGFGAAHHIVGHLFSTYFYANAGMPTEQAFNFTLGQYALGFFGTIGSWVLMSYFGRRSLYIGGLIGQMIVLIVIGGLGFAPPDAIITQQKRQEASGAQVAVNVGASWAVGSLLLVFTLVFDITVGPVCYAIVGECSSTRLRQKTVVLARMLYNICGIIINIITPIMLNPAQANLGAKTALVWAGITVCCITWCWFRLPETKNRTFAELTILFENKVNARKFKTTEVDAFRSTSIVIQRAKEEEKFAGAAGGVH